MKKEDRGVFLVSLLKVKNKKQGMFLLECIKFEKWVVLAAERANM